MAWEEKVVGVQELRSGRWITCEREGGIAPRRFVGAAFAAALIVGGLAAPASAAPATAAQNAANSVPVVIKCDTGAPVRSQRALDAERARLIAKEEALDAAAGLQVRSQRALAAESARLTAQAQAAGLLQTC